MEKEEATCGDLWRQGIEKTTAAYYDDSAKEWFRDENRERERKRVQTTQRKIERENMRLSVV